MLAVLVLAALGAAADAFRLASPALRDGGDLPLRYVCGGNASSPPLSWTDPPPGAQTFALIFAEPLAGVQRTLWVVYNIPASARGLESRHVWLSRSKDGTLQGRNSDDRTGYAGPCPRTRQARRYRLTLYALDAHLPDKPGYDAGQLVKLMQDHVLAQSALTVSYQR